MRRLIVIAPYDPAWPAMFEAEKAQILKAIGLWLEAVEHVGSTAVPGLGAKPVIDIMAGVRSLDEAVHCIGPLEALDYEYVPEFEDEMPYRRYFRKDTEGTRSHQIHMVVPGGEFWLRHLAFRDHLRAHPADRDAYHALKVALAERHVDDVGAYTDDKTDFIRGIEAQCGLTETR